MTQERKRAGNALLVLGWAVLMPVVFFAGVCNLLFGTFTGVEVLAAMAVVMVMLPIVAGVFSSVFNPPVDVGELCGGDKDGD